MSFQSAFPAPAIRRSRAGPITPTLPFLTRLRDRLRRYADLAGSARQLEALTDRELSDIGLSRHEIRKALRTGRG